MSGKMGLIVGIGIAAAIILFIVMLVFFPSHSDPTSVTMAEGALDLYDTTTPLNELLGYEPSGEGNAGDDYDKALDVYRKNKGDWDDLIDRMNRSKEGTIVGDRDKQLMQDFAAHVHRGAQQAKCDYSAAHGTKKPVVLMQQSDTFAMEQLGTCMAYYINYLTMVAKDNKTAEAAAKDMLVMGWHITKERAYVYSVYNGLCIQMEACNQLQEIYKANPDMAKGDIVGRLGSYTSELKSVGSDVVSRLQPIWNVQPKAGDFFNVIDNGKDPAWRVQAILGLGLVKYYSESNRGDRRYTYKLLEKYSNEGTELEKRAAKAALAFTREEFRSPPDAPAVGDPNEKGE